MKSSKGSDQKIPKKGAQKNPIRRTQLGCQWSYHSGCQKNMPRNHREGFPPEEFGHQGKNDPRKYGHVDERKILPFGTPVLGGMKHNFDFPNTLEPGGH